VSTLAIAPAIAEAVASEARRGLTATPKTLSPWLFYDETGSQLFEQITELPEYYLTRTERELFTAHANAIFQSIQFPSDNGHRTADNITIVELGAGTASKTGILLRALTRLQSTVLFQPVDISPSALQEARVFERAIPGLTVRPQIANYITEPIHIEREPNQSVLALYIGSSIGNFSPPEARAILSNLRAQLQPGDFLLLGTDLAPGASKSVATLLAAYDDPSGVTAAFNRNILARLNRELGCNFNLEHFSHLACWNAAESRIEMHLESTCNQTVCIPENSAGPRLGLRFAAGETIHTENSYKFTTASIAALLANSGFALTRTFADPQGLFAVTLAAAI
jgi:dimethylhistidine N-methyltransferase